MNDLVKLVFAQIPKYLFNFFNLVSGPKRFVRKRNVYNDQSLTEATTFLAISFVLQLVLKTPFITDVNFWQYIATLGLQTLIEMTLLATALRFAWTLVGGHAPFGRFFITFCYYYAVGLILLQAFAVLAYGIAKVWDPELYAIMVEAYKGKSFSNPKMQAYVEKAAGSGDFKKLLPLASLNLMLWLGWAAFFAWTIAGWGAYRELTTLTKKRSVLAGIIFICLYPIVFLVTFLLYSVLV
ncbi:MAG TPA: hypothetical protein VGL91_22775 [Acidobacteriota bacterium]|jgi:hypothetical protein